MNRTKRLNSRNNRMVTRLNDTARVIDSTLSNIGIPASDKEDFIKWTLSSFWTKYKENRMNQRIMTEHEILNLNLRFANGTVKKEYCENFELPIDKIHNIQLIGAKELGLKFEIDREGRCTLSGMPITTGDYSLILRFNTIKGEPASELSYPIAFNPDPRDLWQNIPTNPDIPYYKPDCEAEYIKVRKEDNDSDSKDLVAASLRGRSHAMEGKPRDDHFSLYHCEDSDWYIIAVADGAGSAKYSRKGSLVACETIKNHCKDLLLDNPDFENSIRTYQTDRENTDKRTALTRHVIDIIYKGAMKAHDAIKKIVAATDDSRLKDFATTLMFAVCKRFDFGWFIASFWVGDGAMCLYDENNKTAKLLGSPDEGEFSGQTRFITMPEIFRDPEAVAKRLRMTIVPDFTALFLMTDGISDPMFETDRNLNDFNSWETFVNTLINGFPEDGIEGIGLKSAEGSIQDRLLRWLEFWSQGNHDDRTIAILY